MHLKSDRNGAVLQAVVELYSFLGKQNTFRKNQTESICFPGTFYTE